MRVLIAGTGGVGGYFGARLQQAGNDVWFLARGENLDALRERGLRLHSDFGDLDLTYETMQLSADEGLMMFVYTAEVGSKSEEALNLLASWTATLDEAEPANVSDES